MNHPCERLVEAAEYLEGQGMTAKQLRRLHHFDPPTETFASTRRYFGTNRELRGRNLAYADRMIFVAERHRKSGSSFAVLLEEALHRWPVVGGQVQDVSNPWLSVADAIAAGGSLFVEADQLELGRRRGSRPLGRRFRLDLVPEPYFGLPNAPVVLLTLNPGFTEDDISLHRQPEFRALCRLSLRHELAPFPFLHLQPEGDTPGGRWWKRRAALLIDALGLQAVSRGLLCLQYVGYKSSTFEGWPYGCTLPSQRYTFALLRAAMKRDALVIVMRSCQRWLDAVPELAYYPHRLLAANPRAAYLSQGNLGEGGFSKVCQRIAVGG